MILKSGTIIPFRFKDTKKLIAIPSLKNKQERLTISDVKAAIYSAFENLRNKCEFYNPQIEFQIPEQLFISYLEQCHDLTNFVVKIVETDEKKEIKQEDCNRLQQKTIESKKPLKRDGTDVSPKLIKKLKLDFFDQHLDNIIQSSSEGQAICNNFKSSNELNEENRLALIKLIINVEFENLLESNVPIAIDTQRLANISSAIVRKFPSENPSYYHVQYSESLKHIAGGKLYEEFQAMKIQYMQMESSDRYCSTSEGTIEADFPELKDLQAIRADWSTYSRVWEYTYELRMTYIRNILDPLPYFDKLIATFPDRSIDLVEQDFEKLHPKKNCILFENWDRLCERIFTEALVLCRNDVPLILDMYGKMSELSGLMLLSYFVQNYEREVKPFEKDDPGNLVIHIESIDGDPEEFFKDYCETYNLPTPIVFATGKTPDELNCYVLVGSNFFYMETASCAVDFCFKCYRVLQLAYPTKQSLIWQVIQNAFYDIYTEYDCMVSENFLKIFKN